MITLQHSAKRLSYITAFVRKNETDPLVADALQHRILCYNICTDNRNILMHSTYFAINESTTRLVKRASNDPKRELHFDVPLRELRIIADQIADVCVYAREIYGFIFRREHRARIAPDAEPLQSSALPEKPPKAIFSTARSPKRILRAPQFCHRDIRLVEHREEKWIASSLSNISGNT